MKAQLKDNKKLKLSIIAVATSLGTVRVMGIIGSAVGIGCVENKLEDYYNSDSIYQYRENREKEFYNDFIAGKFTESEHLENIQALKLPKIKI